VAGLLSSGRSTRLLAFLAVFGSRGYKDQDEDALWYFGIKDGLRSTSSPSGSVREVLQIGLRQGGHGRLAVFDVAPPDQEPRHDQGRQ
jgi:hypothetical protein